MPKSVFRNLQIRSIYSVIPSKNKSIDDEVDLFGGNLKQIERLKRIIGLKCRHVVDNQTTTLDLCYIAASQLIALENVDPNLVDGLICVTQTPDHFQPANAGILHGKLKLTKNCAVFDVNMGCSGYVYGLWIAGMMLEVGGCKNVLLLAGDTLSRLVNQRDRSVAPLFGDAGTATLLEKATIPSSSFFSLNSDGSGAHHLILPAGGFRNPISKSTKTEVKDSDGNVRSQENLYMNGPEIFNFSIKVGPASIREVLALADKGAEEIDFFILHQANKFIVENITRRLKIPQSRAPFSTFEKYGNQSSASIPVALCNALSGKHEIKMKTVILSGFGVGLSWATCLLKLEKISCHVAMYEID